MTFSFSRKTARNHIANLLLITSHESGSGQEVLAVGNRQDLLQVNVQVADQQTNQELLPGVAGDHLEEEVEPREVGGLDSEDEQHAKDLVRVLLAEDVYERESEAFVEQEVAAEVDECLADLVTQPN